MPRTLLLLLLLSSLAAPPCAHAAAPPVRQTPAAAAPQQSSQTDEELEGAKRLLAQGNAAGAADALKAIAERRKTDAEAWYQLALALALANRQNDAREAFEKAVKLLPDSAKARAGLAVALLNLDKTGDAEREATRALALDSGVAAAHYVVGAAQARSARYWRAAQEAEEALRLQANFPAAALLLGDALMQLYVGETERINEQYPMPKDANEETRKPVFEKREAALAPFKARMRAAAERLEALADSRPGGASPVKARELAEMLRAYSSEMQDQSAPVLRQAQVTRKALITHKPEPGVTMEARRNNTHGVVRLRAILAADGRVKHILVVKGLPDGLTEKAIEAARQIKFTPAVADGRPISQFVILEYNFN